MKVKPDAASGSGGHFNTQPKTKRIIMKKNTLIALVAVIGAVSIAAIAQDAGGPPQGEPGGPGIGGPGQGGRGMMGRRPMPAIVNALDANHDGVIDADEIANAVAVLKKLDKNGDGKLTREEYMGKPPMRPPQDGAGGPPPDGNGLPDGGPGGPPPQQQ
jgi:hypothetical protein